jgi:hypothetical protein
MSTASWDENSIRDENHIRDVNSIRDENHIRDVNSILGQSSALMMIQIAAT